MRSGRRKAEEKEEEGGGKGGGKGEKIRSGRTLNGQLCRLFISWVTMDV